LAWDYIISPVSQVGQAIVNTLVIGIIVTLLSILVGVPAARVLARREFKGKPLVEFFLLTPLIVPGIAISLGLVVIFIRIRLIDTMTGVILSHLVGTVPYMVRILTSVFAGLSPEYEEQARALGASPLKSFVFVTMPMVLPGIIAGSLFAFLISVNTFLQTFFIGGGRIVTLPTVLFNFIGQGGGSNIPVAAGVTLILSLPGFLFLLLTERYIKEEQFAQGFGG
ncbi:MAG: ABC transporter permease subunit, partial [Deinococcus sp.]|nr:ABC transporter permease subunit [Deinococcus sp.]